MPDNTPLLSLRGLTKSYDTQEALSGIDLDVYQGEFLTLLGPSGCGKTTTLRIIAGLEMPNDGAVFLRGEDITALPPEKRQVNTVFQNYALFPHMSVRQNVAYGLKIRRLVKAEIDQKVTNMLHLVQLDGYDDRLPSQLSGGQRQRVAIARAAVLAPAILLLDEPLGALDLQLRKQMQIELKKMQKTLGITFIYITHDQEEALNMSDRVALMRQGRFVQIDSPSQLYEHPRTAFAASFIGETNLLTATVSAVKEDMALLDIEGLEVPAETQDWVVPGEKLCLSVRAERLHYGLCAPDGHCYLRGVLSESRYTGSERTATITLPSGRTLVSRHTTEKEERYELGTEVCLWWNTHTAQLVIDDRKDPA